MTLPPVNDGESIHDGEVYEMLWDCRFCGTTKLLGKTHRFCPSCGSPQDPEWRYYPADDEKIAVKDHIFVGADRTCPACGTLNAGNAEFCPRCSAPQTEAAKVKQLGLRHAMTGQALAQEDLNARRDAEAAAFVSGKPQVAEESGGWGIWKWLLIAVVLGAIGFGVYTMFSTQESKAVLTDLRWERAIAIEQLSAIPGNSVCNAMPVNAYNVTRRREQVDTRRVQDGETCTRQQVDQGDGTFREQQVCQPKYRSEPVYGDVCYYTVDRWVVNREVASHGNKDTPPYWAETKISRSGACRGCEREGNRSEQYVFVLKTEDNEQHECAVEFNVWQNATIESTWSLEVGRVLGDARCGSLAPAN